MKILAIDYGEKKVGLAISDELEIIASPIPTIFVKDDSDLLKKLSEIISKNKIDALLLGVPSGWKNIDSPQTTIVKKFKEKLLANFALNIIEWDESYSSKFAEKNLVGKQKKNSDSFAAAHILQEYLNYIRYEKKHN